VDKRYNAHNSVAAALTSIADRAGGHDCPAHCTFCNQSQTENASRAYKVRKMYGCFSADIPVEGGHIAVLIGRIDKRWVVLFHPVDRVRGEVDDHHEDASVCVKTEKVAVRNDQTQILVGGSSKYHATRLSGKLSASQLQTNTDRPTRASVQRKSW
jgi:hypothetical protein